MNPPSTGATTGAMAVTDITTENMRAASSRANMSRMTARATTGAAAAPMAWNSRKTMSSSTLVASAQATLATT